MNYFDSKRMISNLLKKKREIIRKYFYPNFVFFFNREFYNFIQTKKFQLNPKICWKCIFALIFLVYSYPLNSNPPLFYYYCCCCYFIFICLFFLPFLFLPLICTLHYNFYPFFSFLFFPLHFPFSFFFLVKPTTPPLHTIGDTTIKT